MSTNSNQHIFDAINALCESGDTFHGDLTPAPSEPSSFDQELQKALTALFALKREELEELFEDIAHTRKLDGNWEGGIEFYRRVLKSEGLRGVKSVAEPVANILYRTGMLNPSDLSDHDMRTLKRTAKMHARRGFLRASLLIGPGILGVTYGGLGEIMQGLEDAYANVTGKIPDTHPTALKVHDRCGSLMEFITKRLLNKGLILESIGVIIEGKNTIADIKFAQSNDLANATSEILERLNPQLKATSGLRQRQPQPISR